MTTGPICCRVDDLLSGVALKMESEDIGIMPVIDAAGRAIGMITDRDICMAAAHRGERLDELRVDAAMTRAVHGVRVDDGVADAERVMRQHKVHRVVVHDEDGRVVGIVSLSDLARCSSHVCRARVSEHEVAATLRAMATRVTR
jgi:CBS domain-containing protein